MTAQTKGEFGTTVDMRLDRAKEQKMSYQKLLPQMIGMTLVILLIAGCSPATPTPEPPTSTPIPPTNTPQPTPIPPTPTPTCQVNCEADGWDWEITITCESGQYTTALHDSVKYGGHVYTATLDQERTYENTGNKYKIAGDIVGDVSKDTASFYITVTGGVFGENTQHCQNY